MDSHLKWMWQQQIHGYSSKAFRNMQTWYLLSVQEKKQSLSVCVCVWEREKAANSVPAFPCGSLTTGRQAAEWPNVPTSGVLLLSTGPLRSERCCFLGCSKPLHILKKNKKETVFQILLCSEKLQNKVEISMEVNGAKIVRKFSPD